MVEQSDEDQVEVQCDDISNQDLFQQEQIDLMKEYNVILKNTHQLRVSEDEEKKSAAIKRVKKKCKLIRSEVDNLSEVVNKVPYDSWKNEPDLLVSEAMN